MLPAIGRGLELRIPRQETTPCGKLVLGTNLQSGAHGSVRVATSCSGSRTSYAVKVAHGNDESVGRLESEGRILHALPAHRNVVRVFSHLPPSSDPHTGRIFLPMELCDTDVLDLMMDTRLTSAEVLAFASQLVSAVQHCHTHHVAHLDIKPENLLVSFSDGQIRLADFGMAHYLTPEAEQHFTGVHGSASYAAPEVWNCEQTTSTPKTYSAFAADVWSIGAVLFTMVFRRRPWEEVVPSNKHFAHYVNTGELLPPAGEDSCSPALLKLMKMMMSIDPETRPTLDDVAKALTVIASSMERSTAARATKTRSPSDAGASVSSPSSVASGEPRSAHLHDSTDESMPMCITYYDDDDDEDML